MTSLNIYEKIPIKDYTSKEVYVISPNDTLAYARKILLKNGISRLVVIEEGKLKGIISLRDIALTLIKLGKEFPESLDQILIKNVMKKELVKLPFNSSVKKACDMMIKNKIGSVIVTKEEELFGIFTKTDACKVFADHPLENFRVKNIMITNPLTINYMASLWKVVDKFQREENIIIVEDNKKPVGVITLSFIANLNENDFLRRKVKYVRGFVEKEKIKVGKKAEDIMLKINIGINEEEKLTKAVNYILSYNLPGIPVINNVGEIIGIVTKTNITTLISMN